MPKELGVSLMLNSLNKDYDQFIQNYNMHSMGKTLAELHTMLKLYEKGLRESRKFKNGALRLYMKNGMRTTVEAIRSFDLILPGGEYLSHEFVNHMKSCGIVSQLTPPYTPQHNRVSDMVPTKKVDRAPYEIWHGKSPKIPQVPDRYGYYVDIEDYELGDLNEPPNYKDALAYLKSKKWLEAMNTKMQSMKDNQVWYLVDILSNGRTVGYKWFFKKNTHIDGKVHTLKARLVAKGFTQTCIVDYGETFSPVANIRAIRILLAIATFYDYEIWKMDSKTAFLNGHLSKDVYMVKPEGFVDLKHPNKVCRLQSFIYGLKQASGRCNKMFDEEIKKTVCTQNPDKPSVYLKASGSNVAFLLLYVNDILLMGNSVAMLQEVNSWLYKCFSMKDLREVAYILGIKIIHDRSKRLIALSQSAYQEKTLKKFRMEKPDYRKSQGAKTPTEVQRMHRVPYTSAIGSIMAKPEDELKVFCYVDKSAKQSTTAMSSIEAEYIATAKVSIEAAWMRKFIDGLGDVMPSNKRPMEMLCDNDPRILKGDRHFQRKYNYIHEVIQQGEITLKKGNTNENVADPFTKPMPLNKHFEHAMAI
nr:hypothetical protein [Tanacetum cinerariifolium]